MKSAPLLLFFICSLGYAQLPIGELIQELETVPSGPTPDNKDPNRCSTRSIQSPEMLINQCAIDICGPPSENRTSWLTEATLASYTEAPSERIKRALFNLLRPPLRKQVEKNQVRLGYLKSLIPTLKTEIPSWTTEDVKEVASGLFFDYIEISIDHTKPRNERFSIEVTIPNPSKELVATIHAYKKLITSQTINDSLLMTSEEILTREEAYQELLSFYQETINELKRVNQPSQRLEATLREISNQPDLDRLTIIQRFEEASSERQSAIPNWNYGYNQFENEEVALKNTLTTYLQSVNFSKIINDLRMENTLPNLTQRNLAKCSSFIMSANLRNYRTGRIRRSIPRVIRRYKRQVIKNFSRETKTKFEDNIQTNLKVIYDNIRHISEEDVAEQIGTEITNFNQYDLREDPRAGLSLMSLLKLGIDEDFDFFSNYHICSANSFRKSNKLIWDQHHQQTREKTNQIFVSMFSSIHPDIGKELFAHELGHFLSTIFRRSLLSDDSYLKYKNLRMCITNRHNSDQFKRVVQFDYYHSDDNQYTEEDMANALMAMTYPNERPLMNCSLLIPNSNNDGYEEMTFRTGDYSSYSTRIARVLFEALDKKISIPESCNQAMNQQTRYRFTPCF